MTGCQASGRTPTPDRGGTNLPVSRRHAAHPFGHTRPSDPTGRSSPARAVRPGPGDENLPGSAAGAKGGTTMRGILGAIVVIWLVIGVAAAVQRGYFGDDQEVSCATAGTTAVTVLAGPLNYVGANPKVDCEVPEPSS
ncbi:hypothetical protein NOK12_18980 [Nocardioides sp. OK12]|nr:hypothetical protein NOK12_18980 [Nocardioides sp. OK12]